LRTTSEFGCIWVGSLLISAWFGLEWVAIAHSCAVLLYSPFLLRRTLPLIDCPAFSYAQAIMIPTIVTAACMVIFVGLTRVMSIDELPQLCLGGALAILGILASGLAQRRVLLQGIVTMA
jgi:hypothetical protein